jgi:hypothetical protein
MSDELKSELEKALTYYKDVDRFLPPFYGVDDDGNPEHGSTDKGFRDERDAGELRAVIVADAGLRPHVTVYDLLRMFEVNPDSSHALDELYDALAMYCDEYHLKLTPSRGNFWFMRGA